MNNFKLLDTNNTLACGSIKLVESNLWMDPTTKKEDLSFWVERFKDQRINFVLMQFDTELMNDKREKMYRKVYGLFIDMRSWEKNHADGQTNKN